MPYVKVRAEGRGSSLRRRKRQALRVFMFIAFIAAATFALNLFFSFSSYMPDFNEPKDFDRELLMQKLDKATEEKACPSKKR